MIFHSDVIDLHPVTVAFEATVVIKIIESTENKLSLFNSSKSVFFIILNNFVDVVYSFFVGRNFVFCEEQE